MAHADKVTAYGMDAAKIILHLSKMLFMTSFINVIYSL